MCIKKSTYSHTPKSWENILVSVSFIKYLLTILTILLTINYLLSIN